MKNRKSVKEPVQVYLDRPDVDLLTDLAERLELPRTEVLRRGLRGLAAEVLGASGPMMAFLDAAGTSAPEGVPDDVAANHDRYLADAEVASWTRPPSVRRRGR